MFQKLRISASKTKKENSEPPTEQQVQDEVLACASVTEPETDPITTNSDAKALVNSVHPADDSVSSSSFTLLEELADALIGAVAVYGMADVRSLLRASQNGGTSNDSSSASTSPIMSGDPELLRKAMELPISRSEMMQLLQLNLDALHDNKIPADLYLSLLDSLGGALNSSSGTSTDAQSSSSGNDADTAAANNINARWLHSIFKNIPMPAVLSSALQQGEEDAKGTNSTANSPPAPPPPSVYVAVFDDENSNKELVYYIAIDE
jgi:hypothetical protein